VNSCQPRLVAVIDATCIESERARLLVAVTPAGVEGVLEDLRRTDCVGVEQLITVAARYGITITGPVPKAPAEAHQVMDDQRS
jgi:hypothetical protein